MDLKQELMNLLIAADNYQLEIEGEFYPDELDTDAIQQAAKEYNEVSGKIRRLLILSGE